VGSLWTSSTGRVHLLRLNNSEIIMAKGQQKSAREKKKPKKEKQEGMKGESSYKQNFKK